MASKDRYKGISEIFRKTFIAFIVTYIIGITAPWLYSLYNQVSRELEWLGKKDENVKLTRGSKFFKAASVIGFVSFFSGIAIMVVFTIVLIQAIFQLIGSVPSIPDPDVIFGSLMGVFNLLLIMMLPIYALEFASVLVLYKAWKELHGFFIDDVPGTAREKGMRATRKVINGQKLGIVAQIGSAIVLVILFYSLSTMLASIDFSSPESMLEFYPRLMTIEFLSMGASLPRIGASIFQGIGIHDVKKAFSDISFHQEGLTTKDYQAGRKCNNCGAPLPDDARFCPVCGSY
ncbi:MAG: zinc ribbon domain-containing protein [Candidatus Hodarchaeota archaeon]